jgi:hypothetical protein
LRFDLEIVKDAQIVKLESNLLDQPSTFTALFLEGGSQNLPTDIKNSE